MALALVAPPAAEPLSLTEAKAHLRVDGTDEDTLITALIQAAREYAESRIRGALITQTWALTLDRFPRGAGPLRPLASGAIEIPFGPVQSVTSVAYTDANGAPQTLSASLYVVDTASRPARIAPAPGEVWPDTEPGRIAAVTVTLIAGYGGASTDVPGILRAAMKLHLGDLYEHREETLTGAAVTPLRAVRDIYERHRFDRGYA